MQYWVSVGSLYTLGHYAVLGITCHYAVLGIIHYAVLGGHYALLGIIIY